MFLWITHDKKDAMSKILFILFFLSACFTGMAQPKTIVYHLQVSDTTVNYTGKTRKAIAINGQIPAPILYFTEGDTAEIHVHNTLKTETSLHWHGLILPNRMDGVPYLTTAPIKAGETAVYKFPIVQSGTYWYHSHTKLQEQSGMYGSLIIHKRNEPPMKEYVLLLSDWTNEHPLEVHRSLRAANDWYMIKKGATQNYFEAIKTGNLGVKLKNEWKRMHAMDVSDVYYDALLANGKQETEFPPLKPREKIRLRIINGSSSTYFWLQFAGGKMSVVANDGMDVVPVEVDRMIIGVAETYDIVVSIPDNMSYEFRATAEDRTKHTSLWLGEGMKMPAPDLPKLDYFAGMKMMNGMMKMNGDLDDMGMHMSVQKMDMNEVMYPELHDGGTMKSDTAHAHHKGMDMPEETSQRIVTLNYGMLRSPVKTVLPDAPWKELHFKLEGNMNRYVWSLDNKVLSESDRILIKQGENVRIIMYNNSMMRHPMHLHGHFFRVLNGQGDYVPLKNVVDILPMETDTLEFAATENGGDWFFHCHILYHMMSGMGRVFTYENSPPNPDIPDPKKSYRKFLSDDREVHPMFHAGLASNGTHGEAMLSNTRYALGADWHTGWNDEDGYMATVRFGRYLGKMQYWFPYIAWDYHYSSMHTENNRSTLMFGLTYTLPWMVVADVQADIEGNVRLNLTRKDLALTSRLRLDMSFNTDLEYRFDLRYILTKYFSVAGNYDSDIGFGGGIVVTY